jgi:hypothetical protein
MVAYRNPKLQAHGSEQYHTDMAFKYAKPAAIVTVERVCVCASFVPAQVHAQRSEKRSRERIASSPFPLPEGQVSLLFAVQAL